MATNKWTGNAAAVAQVDTFTPASVTIGNTFTLSCSTKSITFTATAATVANVTAGLTSLVNASTIPEFQEVVAADATTALTLTSRTAGVVFTITSSAAQGAGSGGMTLTRAATTTSSGPNDWNVAGNWTAGVVPQGLCIAPTLGTPGLVAAGTLADATPFYYKVSATNANGESLPSPEVTKTTASPSLEITLAWTAIPGATGYLVYRSLVSGSYVGSHLLAIITSGATVTYADTGAASLVAGSPLGGSTAVGDDVVFDQSSVDCSYSLDQHTLTLASFTQTAAYTGRIGLPDYNGAYYQYRPLYLQIGMPTITIGAGPGTGSGRTKLDAGAVQTAVTVFLTGAASDAGFRPFMFKGTHASNTMTVYSGQVGIATDVGAVSTIATLTTGLVNGSGDASVLCGVGVTMGTINQNSGAVVLNAGATTVNAFAGLTVIYGAGAFTTMTITSGTVFYESSGTLTTLVIAGGGAIDFTRDQRARTVSSCVISAGAKVIDSFSTVTWSAGVKFRNCNNLNTTVDLGTHLTLTPSSF